jgi:uncharacterized protein YlaI
MNTEPMQTVQCPVCDESNQIPAAWDPHTFAWECSVCYCEHNGRDQEYYHCDNCGCRTGLKSLVSPEQGYMCLECAELFNRTGISNVRDFLLKGK